MSCADFGAADHPGDTKVFLSVGPVAVAVAAVVALQQHGHVAVQGVQDNAYCLVRPGYLVQIGLGHPAVLVSRLIHGAEIGPTIKSGLSLIRHRAASSAIFKSL